MRDLSEAASSFCNAFYYHNWRVSHIKPHSGFRLRAFFSFCFVYLYTFPSCSLEENKTWRDSSLSRAALSYFPFTAHKNWRWWLFLFRSHFPFKCGFLQTWEDEQYDIVCPLPFAKKVALAEGRKLCFTCNIKEAEWAIYSAKLRWLYVRELNISHWCALNQ